MLHLDVFLSLVAKSVDRSVVVETWRRVVEYSIGVSRSWTYNPTLGLRLLLISVSSTV